MDMFVYDSFFLPFYLSIVVCTLECTIEWSLLRSLVVGKFRFLSLPLFLYVCDSPRSASLLGNHRGATYLLFTRALRGQSPVDTTGPTSLYMFSLRPLIFAVSRSRRVTFIPKSLISNAISYFFFVLCGRIPLKYLTWRFCQIKLQKNNGWGFFYC